MYNTIPRFMYNTIPIFMYNTIPIFMYNTIPRFMYNTEEKAESPKATSPFRHSPMERPSGVPSDYIPIFMYNTIPIFMYNTIPRFMYNIRQICHTQDPNNIVIFLDDKLPSLNLLLYGSFFL